MLLKIVVSVEPCLASVVVWEAALVRMRLGRKKITVYSLQKTRLHHWLQDTRFATSPTRHRIAGCERSVRADRFPETQVSIVSIALRDQLIHTILVWRAVQRESLTRQGSKAGKIRVRTGRESDRLRWEPEEKLSPSYIVVLFSFLHFQWKHLNNINNWI